MAKEEEQEDETKENIVALVTFAIILLVIISAWNNWWGLFSSSTDNPIVTTPIQGEPIKGDPNAPVTIVEYSDFECPFCGRFFKQTYPALLRKYVEQGEVNIVYKNYPLTSSHENALDAAIAGECAYRQDNFWDYHDKLFNNQNALGVEALKSYAEQVGLDTGEFNSCLDNELTKAEVEEDSMEGGEASVASTPTFIVGTRTPRGVRGELIVGAKPLNAFTKAIERQG